MAFPIRIVVAGVAGLAIVIGAEWRRRPASASDLGGSRRGSRHSDGRVGSAANLVPRTWHVVRSSAYVEPGSASPASALT